MAKLSKAAVAMLEDAGCNEIDDDFIVIGTTDVRVLLSHRAVADLNRQAREWAEAQPD
jgi:hypothetical protein